MPGQHSSTGMDPSAPVHSSLLLFRRVLLTVKVSRRHRDFSWILIPEHNTTFPIMSIPQEWHDSYGGRPLTEAPGSPEAHSSQHCSPRCRTSCECGQGHVPTSEMTCKSFTALNIMFASPSLATARLFIAIMVLPFSDCHMTEMRAS